MNIIDGATRMVDMSVTNYARRAVGLMAGLGGVGFKGQGLALPGSGRFMQQIPADVRPNVIKTSEVMEQWAQKTYGKKWRQHDGTEHGKEAAARRKKEVENID